MNAPIVTNENGSSHGSRGSAELIHLLLIIALVLLATLLLVDRVERLTEKVWTVKLVAGCYLDYYTPIQAVTLACPGVDYIRLWPLSVEQPWPDPSDKPEPWAVRPRGGVFVWVGWL